MIFQCLKPKIFAEADKDQFTLGKETDEAEDLVLQIFNMAERISAQPVKFLKTLKNVQTAIAKVRGHLERFLSWKRQLLKIKLRLEKLSF